MDLKWKEAVLSNLGAADIELQSYKKVPVARHHWLVVQLRHFKANNTRPSMLIRWSLIKTLTNRVDPEDCIQRKNDTLYYNTPNVPRSEIDAIVNPVSQERGAHSEARQLVFESNEKEQKRKDFENLTFDQFTALEESLSASKRNARGKKRKAQYEISLLEREIQQLQEQVKKQNNAAKAKEQQARATTKSPTNVTEICSMYFSSEKMESLVNDLLANEGGESRLQFTSEEWHAKHPEAANNYFGFRSFAELKLYVTSFFWDVEIEVGEAQYDPANDSFVIKPTHLTKFEQLLVVKYFMHVCPVRKRTASVFGIHRTTVLKYMNEWAPRWAKYGEHLSILPIPRDYWAKELPDDLEEVGLMKNGFMLDGKDTQSETVHKDDGQRRRQHSSKMHSSSFCWINFVSNTALSFEHTRPFLARVEETALVEMIGSYGVEKAPVKEWKGYAKTCE